MNLRQIPTDAEYAAQKQQEYKLKKLQEQVKNNRKSAQGFGYEYKPIQFDYASDAGA
jgi:hypothetical protein